MIFLNTKEPKFSEKFSNLLKQRRVFKTELEEKIKKIFSEIEKSGMEAVLRFARRFEGFSGSERDLKVSKKELVSARALLSQSQIKALELAQKRIEKFHRQQIPKSWRIKEDGGFLAERWVPLQNVGIYIPGGKAPLASTVLMTAIPAKLAQVKRIVLTTPAGSSGKIHPAILFSAQLCGIEEIYKIGGAQAIAGLALGAGVLKKVDKIVGPGGIWVSSAKLYAQAQGLVGIDTLAGPSEILILSDGSAPIEFALEDLKAQLEHGEEGWAFLISTKESVLEKVRAKLKTAPKHLLLIKSRSQEEMIELANRIAPEHLELHTKNPEQLVPKLFTPSAIYLGAYSPVALGDYLVGPNHCLPTGARAVYDSPLGVLDFMKRQSVVKLNKNLLRKIGKPGSDFAEMEGLFSHSQSIKIRLKK